MMYLIVSYLVISPSVPLSCLVFMSTELALFYQQIIPVLSLRLKETVPPI